MAGIMTSRGSIQFYIAKMSANMLSLKGYISSVVGYSDQVTLQFVRSLNGCPQ